MYSYNNFCDYPLLKSRYAQLTAPHNDVWNRRLSTPLKMFLLKRINWSIIRFVPSNFVAV